MRPSEGWTDIQVRITEELAAELDQRRGRSSRAAYVRRLLERATGIDSPSSRVRRRPGTQESALADDLERIARRHTADHKGQGESPRSQKEA
jgi:Arc/MetJ family transcription regulator